MEHAIAESKQPESSYSSDKPDHDAKAKDDSDAKAKTNSDSKAKTKANVDTKAKVDADDKAKAEEKSDKDPSGKSYSELTPHQPAIQEALNNCSKDGHPGDIDHGKANAVPVPAATWLFGSGIIGVMGLRRRHKAK